MKVIIEYQYFPPIYLFSILYKATHIIFEQYEHYQKMSFRNRSIIAGPNGLVQLSIPLKDGREQRGHTAEVKMSGRYQWNTQHWKTIQSCYNRSPWFEFYREELKALYLDPGQGLADWNFRLFEWVRAKLGLVVETGHTSEYLVEYNAAEFMDLRNEVLPKNYHNLPSPAYTQVFQNGNRFWPNLSIIDLLFCEGPGGAARLMKHTAGG